MVVVLFVGGVLDVITGLLVVVIVVVIALAVEGLLARVWISGLNVDFSGIFLLSVAYPGVLIDGVGEGLTLTRIPNFISCLSFVGGFQSENAFILACI